MIQACWIGLHSLVGLQLVARLLHTVLVCVCSTVIHYYLVS
jgi:hypothetical protein